MKDGPNSPDLLKFMVMFLDNCAALCFVTPASLASIYADNLMLFSKASFTLATYWKNCFGFEKAYCVAALTLPGVSASTLRFSITLFILSE